MLSIQKPDQYTQWAVVDGCKSGWVLSFFKHSHLNLYYVDNLTYLNDFPLHDYFIDIPVKLPNDILHYPRDRDKLAKSLLKTYHSSIFYAPLQEWLKLHYSDINSICELNNKPKLSIQSFNLFSKIQEAHKSKSSAYYTLHETHPELLIHHFLKKKFSKKTLQGQEQRLYCIKQHFKININLAQINLSLKRLKQQFSGIQCSVDDLIDTIFVASLINHFNLINITQHDFNSLSDDLINRFSLYH